MGEVQRAREHRRLRRGRDADDRDHPRSEKFADTYLQQIPLGRWAEAGDVARPVCFLLSDAASYITGQHLSANGGYTIGT
jgi:NAD(P)-dependent dehydrogenase (short-subunit alcohol dehydrogenase family)